MSEVAVKVGSSDVIELRGVKLPDPRTFYICDVVAVNFNIDDVTDQGLVGQTTEVNFTTDSASQYCRRCL